MSLSHFVRVACSVGVLTVCLQAVWAQTTDTTERSVVLGISVMTLDNPYCSEMPDAWRFLGSGRPGQKVPLITLKREKCGVCSKSPILPSAR